MTSYEPAGMVAKKFSEMSERILVDGTVVIALRYGRPKLALCRLEHLRPEVLARIDQSRRQRNGKPMESRMDRTGMDKAA